VFILSVHRISPWALAQVQRKKIKEQSKGKRCFIIGKIFVPVEAFQTEFYRCEATKDT